MSDVTGTYYAADGSKHGYGTEFLVGDGASPEGFDAVAEVRNIAPGKMETAVFDRTHLRSPNAHREKLAALRDSGPFSLELNWRPRHESQSYTGAGGSPATSSFQNGGLLRMHVDRTTKNFKIVFPDGSPGIEVPFTGVITGYQIGQIGVDDGPNLTIEITPLNGAWHSSLP